MDKISLINFFDSYADQWELHLPTNGARLRCLTELFGVKEGSRVLDAACGAGILEPFLLEKNPSYILAADFSSGMIQAARDRCNDPRVEFLCADVMELNNGEFDCAVLLGAFPYFENRGSLIRQMHHLLAPGGRLTICHARGRTEINSNHQSLALNIAMPLPAAHVLAKSLEQTFDVDILIDTPELYAVSGLCRPL